MTVARPVPKLAGAGLARATPGADRGCPGKAAGRGPAAQGATRGGAGSDDRGANEANQRGTLL